MGCFSSKSKNNAVSALKSRKESGKKETKSLTIHESISDIYTLEETIATLPYGTIVRATHNQSQIKRAVKIINLKLSRTFTINDRHLRLEVNTLSNLDHPNILSIFDILHDDLKLFIITEYWEGGLLLEKIKEEGFISEKFAGLIIHQILSAVNYCHLKKVIHRDLNPKVIYMMNKQGEPQIKVGEFGSSVFIDPEHKFEGKFDSSAYVAPEIAKEDYNEKCDLWSVGVIMYVLLAGRTPFCDDLTSMCEESLKSKPVSYQPLISNGISSNAIDLLNNLLIYDYNDRISAEEALKHKWFEQIGSQSDSMSKNLIEALNHLGCYASTSRLIDAIQGFIARQVVTHKENKDLIEVFKALDSNWDGKLSKEELLKYYKKTMPLNDANKLVEQIFLSADSDDSGFIEYSEFLKCSSDINNLVSRQNLEKAFQMMDCDNNGKLNRKEIQSILDGTALSGDKKWMKLLASADKNQDGEIDLKEFYDMLLEFK